MKTLLEMNRPILCRYTMPRSYRTSQQWEMFIEARMDDIEELQEVIKIANELKDILDKD